MKALYGKFVSLVGSLRSAPELVARIVEGAGRLSLDAQLSSRR